MRWRHARSTALVEPSDDSSRAACCDAVEVSEDLSKPDAPPVHEGVVTTSSKKRWGAIASGGEANTVHIDCYTNAPVARGNTSCAQLWLDGSDQPSSSTESRPRQGSAQRSGSVSKALEWLDATGSEHPFKEARDAGRPYWPLAVEQALNIDLDESSSQSSSESADDAQDSTTMSLSAMGIGSSSHTKVMPSRHRRLRSASRSRNSRDRRRSRDNRLPRPKKASTKKSDKPQPELHIDDSPSKDGAPPLVTNGRNLRRARKRAETRQDERAGAEPVKPNGCVVLIREDCRLHDNPALFYAAQEHPWVVPLYVHGDDDPSPWPVRGAGLWWRHESLQYFNNSLRKLGSRICYRKGNYIEQVVNVLMDTGATALYFNRQLEPWHIKRDKELESTVSEALGLQVKSFKGMVAAFEPSDVKKKGENKGRIEDPLPTVTRKLGNPDSWPWSLEIEALGYSKTGGRKIPPGFRQYNEKRQQLLDLGAADPKKDDWAFEMRRFWGIGEHAAMQRLEEWLKEAAWGCYFPPGLHPRDTAGGRFRADKKWTAIISPYIRFGDLSPRYVYARCRQTMPFEIRRLFTKRVIWRDKAYAQLFRWPDSHSKSIRTMYEDEHWSGTRLQLRRWQRGETGFPLVDAAMRQLWKVGWMCNHLRHVTAQFLIEHLDLNWKDGFAWYDYTLVDTDVAINAMMWQMGGHSGIGAWNFVMHPIYAGKKVDPEGNYVRRWLPELAHLPVEYIHCPWEAPAGTRIAANVLINGVYWQRVIEDLLKARLIHQTNVIAVRKKFPQFVNTDGTEIIPLGKGKVIHLEVRDDIRENDENKITLMMTADDPRSAMRRNLGATKGVHTGIIYDETKRFEAMYDSIGVF